jgi:hypothetical protein
LLLGVCAFLLLRGHDVRVGVYGTRCAIAEQGVLQHFLVEGEFQVLWWICCPAASYLLRCCIGCKSCRGNDGKELHFAGSELNEGRRNEGGTVTNEEC